MKTPKTKCFANVLLTKLNLVAAGLFLAATSSALATVRYVSVNNANSTPPYTNWATAATDIQSAVNAAAAGDEIMVTNGTYAGGSWANPYGDTDCVGVDKPLTLQSVNGPNVTIIDGGGAATCVYLTNNAVLIGFTLTNGVASYTGGGAYCETNAMLINCVLKGNSGGGGGGAYGGTLNNCTLTGNSAMYGGGAWGSTLNNCMLSSNLAYSVPAWGESTFGGPGGGAYGGTLNNCTLTGNAAEGDGGGAYGEPSQTCTLNNCTLAGNSAAFFGGGASGGTLNNCTLTGNSAYFGGGASGCTLNNFTLTGNSASWTGGGAGSDWFGDPSALKNCIVYFNTASGEVNCESSSILNYCCTSPMPTNGVGNITNGPLFVDYSGGNLRLQSNSPCINAGNNAYVIGSNDLDGNPRIGGGTVDIGAYEYQTPASIISYAWLQQYGLPTDGSADHADLDGTGFNVYQDWGAGLNPTNALSVLKMLAPAATNNPAGLVVTWESVNTRTYYLQRSTNLTAQPAFSTIQSNIVGQAGTTSYTDTTATNAGPYFYRVGVGQ